MDEQKAEKEKLANFTQLVKEGDDGVADKKYEIAVAKYVEALALIDDAEVKVKRDNTQQLLKELKENAEKQEAFDQLVKAGDLHVEGKKYQDAIAKYDEALTLIDDAAVKAKKESAQQLLTLEQENAQKMEAFNQLVKAGDDEVKAKNYETAIAKFNEAIGLIDNEDVIDFIAQKAGTNIREMEGILSKVVFFSGLQGKAHASMEDAQEALKDYGETERTDLTADKIINTVCEFFKAWS